MAGEEKIIKIDVSYISSIGIMKLVEAICNELSKQETLLYYDLETCWLTTNSRESDAYKELIRMKGSLREQYHKVRIQYGEIYKKEREGG